jgi:hypothetical protein
MSRNAIQLRWAVALERQRKTKVIHLEGAQSVWPSSNIMSQVSEKLLGSGQA